MTSPFHQYVELLLALMHRERENGSNGAESSNTAYQTPIHARMVELRPQLSPDEMKLLSRLGDTLARIGLIVLPEKE